MRKQCFLVHKAQQVMVDKEILTESSLLILQQCIHFTIMITASMVGV